MAGESVAGVMVSISRVVTKAAIKSERAGAIAFFTISLAFILVCVGCQLYIRASPFVCYHTARCERRRREEKSQQVSREYTSS